MKDDALVRRIVEAALLASSQPLSLTQLLGLFPDDAPAPAGSVERALEALGDASAQRGVELVEVASGFRFQVRSEVQPWVARIWAERQTRYSRALLETLALIAYRQPITRGEIEQIRGVAVSTNIIKTMEEREWIRVVGHRDVPGKPALFGTTRSFLDYFGLKSLDQLPPLTELNELPDFEPQLALEPVAEAAGPMPALPAVDGEPSAPLRAADDDIASAADEGDADRTHRGDEPGHAADDDAATDTDARAAGNTADASATNHDDDPLRSDSLTDTDAGVAPSPTESAGESGATDESKHDTDPVSSEQTP